MKRGAGTRFVVALISLLSVPPAFANDVLKALDTDGDGTVDIEEAETAASKVFHALDRDKDGTLDAQELPAD